MALTLQTSGLATALAFCLAVDDDGTTIKEFVSTDVNANKTIDPAVTVGTASWKRTTRSYYQTAGSGFGPKLISFAAGHRASVNDGNCAFYMALAGAPAGGGTGNSLVFLNCSGVAPGRWTGGTLMAYASSSIRMTSTGTMPTDNTTPWSFGLNWSYNGVSGNNANGCDIYLGLASGSIALDSNITPQGFGNNPNQIGAVGGWAGICTVNAKFHLVAAFSRQLTSTEYTSLHTDWFGALFNTGSTRTSKDIAFSISESSSYGMTLRRSRVIVPATLSETSSINAAVNRTRTISPSVSEAETIAAATNRTRKVATSISESEVVSASMKRSLALRTSISEAETITPSVKRSLALSASISETETITPALKRLRLIATSVAETETINAAIIRLKSLAFGISESESISTIPVMRTRGFSTAIAEGQTVAATIKRTRAIKAAISEATGVTASVGALRTLATAIAESTAITGALSRTRSVVVTLSEVESFAFTLTTVGSVNLPTMLYVDIIDMNSNTLVDTVILLGSSTSSNNALQLVTSTDIILPRTASTDLILN